mmetsp:Transcript_4860/g.6672  ORF Transcript_4860/g.6672 Transcript_4860/m.6672 type:complete len:769 (+) Transcript_4860:94-2400(+)
MAKERTKKINKNDQVKKKDKKGKFKKAHHQIMYCSQHKLSENVLKIAKKTCEIPTCNKSPSFNTQEECNAIYCSQHKLPNMINIMASHQCSFEGCKTRPSYYVTSPKKSKNQEANQAKASKISTLGGSNKTNSPPKAQSRKKAAGSDGDQSGSDALKTLCIPCINMKSTDCDNAHPRCNNCQKKGLPCSLIRKSAMHETGNDDGEATESDGEATESDEEAQATKLVAYSQSDAEKGPSGDTAQTDRDQAAEKPGVVAGSNTATGVTMYCCKHTIAGVIRISDRTCEIPTCNKSPSFNDKGEVKAIYCSQHRLPGMINIMKANRCGFAGCKTSPSYYCLKGPKQGRPKDIKNTENSPRKTKNASLQQSKRKKKGKVEEPAEGKPTSKKGVSKGNAAEKEKKSRAKKPKTCEHNGCCTEPYFNHAGEKNGRFCAKHRDSTMVDVRNKRCQTLGCEKLPCFNYRPAKRGLFCSSHKLDGMKDVIHKLCEEPGCEKRAYHNTLEDKHVKYCREHRKQGMVLKNNPRCEHPGCLKQAAFNNLGMKTPRYCGTHREPGMVCSQAKFCMHPYCNSYASYALPGKKKPEYCKKHRLPKMVSVHKSNAPSCAHPCCSKKPSYRFEGEKIRYCAEHKLPGMITDRSRFCTYGNCKKRACMTATVGNGERKRFCSEHISVPQAKILELKKFDAICRHPQCFTESSFHYKGVRGRIYCSVHKLPNMCINVKNSFCEHNGCPSAVDLISHVGKVAFEVFCAKHRKPLGDGVVVKVEEDYLI